MGSGRIPTTYIEGKTIREISDETGIREATLRHRYFDGCTIADIVKCKNGRDIRVAGMTLSEISAITGISRDTLYWRYRHGRASLESLTAEPYARTQTSEQKSDLTGLAKWEAMV